ncbi:DNA polymerase [Spatholobus suberectus]|nr:DNA polymerase [Spatholobus suberectus]
MWSLYHKVTRMDYSHSHPTIPYSYQSPCSLVQDTNQETLQDCLKSGEILSEDMYVLKLDPQGERTYT